MHPKEKLAKAMLKSRAVPKFQSLTGTILIQYHVDVSIHGAGNELELKKEGDKT